MRYIVETQEMPPDSMLDSGVHTEKYFQKDLNTNSWSLKVPIGSVCPPFLAVQNPLLEMSFLSTSLSMQTPGINDASSWQPRLFRLNSLDDILHVRDTEAQRDTHTHTPKVTLRTRLTRPLSSPFFNVSDLAVQIIIFCRRLIRSCGFGPVFGRGEGHAATGRLPPHHTTAGPEPSFHQHVLLSQRCLQQLVRQSCVSLKTPQGRSLLHVCLCPPV